MSARSKSHMLSQEATMLICGCEHFDWRCG